MLEARDLVVRFGGFKALDGLDIDVRRGRLTALIGPNGAGKTTFFNVVSGLIVPNSGSLILDGAPIGGMRPEQVTRRGVLRTFQIARGFPRLTVFEHLMLYEQDNPGERLANTLFDWRGMRRREAEIAERALSVATRLKLGRVIDNRVTDLSGGQKKLLEIGRGLMAAPKLLLLDEPAAGVNPTLVGEIADLLRELIDDGLTILLVEHDMSLVGRIADTVVVMANGRRLAEGSFDEIRDDVAVQEAYLGGGKVDA